MGADSLCYIMDYSGNYYRINEADQLVTAGGKEGASVLTFSQANGRIGAGKKAAFYCMIPAEEKNVEEENAEEETVESGSVSSVKELTYEEVQEAIEKNVSSYDLSEIDWAEYLTHFTYVASGIPNYRDELAKKHSDIEQKICDVLHYIELYETDDDEARDLIELLRVCRENRREIKDELMRIEYFQTHLGTSANVMKAKQALKAVKGLENRKYRPRKYEELFENGTMRSGHIENENLSAGIARPDNTGGQYRTGHTYREEYREYKEERDEFMVTEERYDTPFDGRENDWLSFARQQAEFYRNAGQYIRNIQISLKEIDQEIEAVLSGTEDANCNVAQGYKVFKRLKELRLERKKKSRELQCLYALTDYIDCDALADTCEENLDEVEELMKDEEKAAIAKMRIGEERQEALCIAEDIQDKVG